MIACIPKVHVTCIHLPIRHLKLGFRDEFQLWRCWLSGWKSTPVPSVVNLLTIPLSSVHLILHLIKHLRLLPSPPVFCTSQFSPTPPYLWANYSCLQDPSSCASSLTPSHLWRIVPNLGLLCPFSSHWPSGIFVSYAALCAIAFVSHSQLLHYMYQSQTVVDFH